MTPSVADIVDDRILSWVNAEAGYKKLQDLITALAEPIGELIDILTTIQSSFILDTAVGDQLDKLGAIVGLARSGTDDASYRVSLSIQIEIIQSRLREVNGVDGNWTGTVNNILRIVQLFTGGNNADYAPVYPYSFKLLVPGGLTALQITELFQLIRRALYAGVLGYTIFLLPGNNLWAYANDKGGGVGEWDPGAVPGEGLWAYGVPALKVWQVTAANIFTDQTTGFLNSDPADWFPYPATSNVGDYCAFGYPSTFSFLTLNNAFGAPGTDGISAWEYWNGSTWVPLDNIVDGTDSYKTAISDGQLVSWDLPLDWEKLSLNGGTELYYVRSLTTTPYTSFPEYDSGLFEDIETIPGEWSEGDVPGEAVWNTVFSTSTGVLLANDNT